MITSIDLHLKPAKGQDPFTIIGWKAIIDGRIYGKYYELDPDIKPSDLLLHYPQIFQDILECANKEMSK